MRFEAKINAILTFVRHEVEYISECCRRHYDATVRSLETPGPGAIVNAMKVGLLAGKKSVTGTYTFREVDLLLKALECAERPVIAVGLRHRFREACNKINELTLATNNLFEIFI